MHHCTQHLHEPLHHEAISSMVQSVTSLASRESFNSDLESFEKENKTVEQVRSRGPSGTLNHENRAVKISIKAKQSM